MVKRLAMLGVAVTALAAFAVPSVASAAVWGPLNTNQLLASSNAAFTSSQGVGWTCSNHQLNTHVRTPASSTLDVTSTGWGLCVGTGGAAGCVVTFSTTGLPWAATATSSTVVATSWHVQVTFSGAGCALAGTTINVDGTLNGTWTPSTHSLAFNAGSGSLTATYMGSPVATVTVTGTWTNTAQTLTLT